MGQEMGGRLQREGIYAYLWLTHVEVWKKTTQFCKAIITQLKNQYILKKGHSARKTQRKESLIQAGLGMQIGQDGEKDRIILYPRISRMWKMETLHSMLRERDRNEEKPRWHQDKKAEQNGVPQSSCTDSSFQKHIQTSNSVIKIYSFLEIIKALVSSQLSVCLYSQFWSPPQRKQC